MSVDEKTTARPTEEQPKEPLGWYGRLGKGRRLALWGLLVGWAALGGLFLVSARDEAPPGSREGAGEAGRGDLLLLVLDVGEGAPPGFVLMHPPERGAATVVGLPAGTIVEVPGMGPGSLADALRDAGPDAVAVSVGNVLGVVVPQPVVLDAAGMRSLVEEAGELALDVPAAVEVEREGELRTLFTQGVHRMAASDVLAYLRLDVPGEQELDRLPRQTAVVRALLAEMRSMEASTIGDALDGAQGAELLAEVARSDPRFLTLPVTRSQAPEVVLYDVVPGDGLDAIRESLAEVRAASDDPVRVRLLGAAEGEVAVPAARLLVDAGYRIVLTGRAERTYDETRIVMAENTDALRSVAEDIRLLLGVGRLGVYSESQTVFDVTLFVGRDWARANDIPQPDPTPLETPV